MLLRGIITGAIALTGLLCGVVPEFSKQSVSLTFSSSVYAQTNITDEQITKYARAVWTMETLRQATYNDIKKIMGSAEVPNITCGDSQSLRSLPKEVKELAINYCNEAINFVQKEGLTTTEFNEITRKIKTDKALETRVQNELIKLQQTQQ
jgi:Domain of unknown function (DUF4168)